jgi:hypothetical protein
MSLIQSHEQLITRVQDNLRETNYHVAITRDLFDFYRYNQTQSLREWMSQHRTGITFSQSGCSITLNYETDDELLETFENESPRSIRENVTN